MVGHKIGLTSRAMQMASKMTEPDYGRILDDAMYNDGAQIRADAFLKPRLEVELAFIMGEDLEGPGTRIYDVMRATEFVVPALEIIDYRTEVPRAIVDTIADNAAFGAIVVGGRTIRPMDVDIRWVGATLSKNGIIEESGVSAAVMGHPAAGIAWLVNKLHARRRKAGEEGRSCSAARSRVRSTSRRATSFMPITVRSAPSASRSSEGHDDHSAKRFKRALLAGRQQIGLWCSLPGGYAAEAVAGSGFDWLLFDTEHSPGDLLTVLAQLQAVAPYDVSPVVRPASNDTVLIKRFLDIGAQTLLIPYVQNADEARQAVAAMRYPPDGMRGVSGLTRATRFGRVAGYARRASEELCLLVQIETRRGTGPARGDCRASRVSTASSSDRPILPRASGMPASRVTRTALSAVEDAIRRIRACGKPAGILTPDAELRASAASSSARPSRQSPSTSGSSRAHPRPSPGNFRQAAVRLDGAPGAVAPRRHAMTMDPKTSIILDWASQLAPAGTLRAAINTANPVLTNQGAAGIPGGLAPDIAAELARSLGLAVELIP